MLFSNKLKRELLLILLVSSSASCLLLVVRILTTGSLRLSFLVWNLVLAWVPLLLSLYLSLRLKGSKKPAWPELIGGLVWLLFLPNTFYLITDLIHLQSSGEAVLLYDIAMITSFIINGLLLGYISLYIMHKLLLRYLTQDRSAHIVVQLILLLSSFAIYLGRYLRWNSWDVVINPAGLLFDVSDRLINPMTHMHTYVITLTFYLVIGSAYTALYKLVGVLARVGRSGH